MSRVLFLLISGVGLLAALGTVLSRNLIHAALYLVAFFVVVAGQFVLLDAEFLAAVQVLIYVGAVAILLLFGVMLTRNIQGDDTTTVPTGWGLPAVLVSMALFFVLVAGLNSRAGLKARVARPATAVETQTRTRVVNEMGRAVGDELLTRYALVFEAAGLLLTAALVGAVALAHQDAGETAPPPGEALRAPLPAADEPGPAAAMTEGRRVVA